MSTESSGGSKQKDKVNKEKENSTLGAAANRQIAGSKQTQATDEDEQEKQGKKREGKDRESPIIPGTNNAPQEACKPKKNEALRVVCTDPEIQAHREHMSEHAVICKFMGLWPMERALCQWIKQHWRPKGDINLHLGAKCFFTIVFTNLEDKDRIFDGGPYFFASAGLYMRPWKPNFVPENETFTQVPVWIRRFSLPIDYWGLATLKKIGDKLGTFIKASEATIQRRYTSCTRICVELDVSGALHEGIWLEFRDEDYFQAIDYEQILFRCRKFHEHGHLVRDCPLNRTEEASKPVLEAQNSEIFTKPKTRQRSNRRRPNRTRATPGSTLNTFRVLETDTDTEEIRADERDTEETKN